MRIFRVQISIFIADCFIHINVKERFVIGKRCNRIVSCIDVAVMIIPLGLGLYGLGKVWDVAKKFFTKSTS